MANPMAGYIKVRDPKECETGWAFCRDGHIILDNMFIQFERGTKLVLEDDGYTINIAATRTINKNNY